jgi:cytochrome c oxidase subunit 2
VNEVERADLVSGEAPNLTHLMTRSTFAGSIFRLYEEADDENLDYLSLPEVGTFDRAQLEAWIRDPQGLKPMDPDDGRGMPNFNLSEDQIDQLVDYLSTLR